jgi:hypothetical protein
VILGIATGTQPFFFGVIREEIPRDAREGAAAVVAGFDALGFLASRELRF